MKIDSLSLPHSYLGHVKNGVVVFDAQTSLAEGQPVRVEPLDEIAKRADKIEQLQKLFAVWTEEDGKLSEDQADVLRKALEANSGLSFRSAEIN